MTGDDQATYIFFSQVNHDHVDGLGTREWRHAVTGEVVNVNYTGERFGGLPGTIRGGAVFRPPNSESYICIGKVSKQEFQLNIEPGRRNETLTSRGIQWTANQLK